MMGYPNGEKPWVASSAISNKKCTDKNQCIFLLDAATTAYPLGLSLFASPVAA